MPGSVVRSPDWAVSTLLQWRLMWVSGLIPELGSYITVTLVPNNGNHNAVPIGRIS